MSIPSKIPGPHSPHRIVLAGIVVLYAFFALAYAVSLPPGEGPDEQAHFSVIQHLSMERALPDMRDPDTQYGVVAGFQGPAYYVLASVLTLGRIAEHPPFYYNTALRWGVAAPAYFHGPGQGLLDGPGPLAWYLLRLLSMLLGAGTLLVAYCLFLHVLRDAWWSLAGVAVLGLNPQFIFLHGYITNDTLAVFIGTAAALWLLRCDDRAGWKSWAVGGILFAVGLLTKISAVAFLPVVGACLYRARQGGQSWRAVLAHGGVFAAVISLLAGWWFVRNALLYGDATGLDAARATRLAGNFYDEAPTLAAWFASLPAMISQTFRSATGIVGQMVFGLPLPYYWMVAGLLVAGLVASPFAVRSEGRIDGCHLALCALIVGFALVAFVRFSFVINSSGWQGRFLLPVAAPFLCIVLAGWSRIPRGRSIAVATTALFLLANLYFLVRVIAGVYLSDAARIAGG